MSASTGGTSAATTTGTGVAGDTSAGPPDTSEATTEASEDTADASTTQPPGESGSTFETSMSAAPTSTQGDSTDDGDIDCGPPAVGGRDPLIDDLELDPGDAEPDNTIIETDGRVGYWYTLVGDGTIEPNDSNPLVPNDEDAYEGSYSAILYGIDVVDFALLGMSLHDDCPYDASGYAGLRFWAKAAVPVTVSAIIPAVRPIEERGGACTTNCYDSHSVTIEATDEWQEFVFSWADFQQDGWGTPATFDPAAILGFQWELSGTFVFALDNVAFVELPDAETDGS